jgi:hypothetical protein
MYVTMYRQIFLDQYYTGVSFSLVTLRGDLSRPPPPLKLQDPVAVLRLKTLNMV